MTPTIRPLERRDLGDLAGTATARGWAVDLDGKTICVCGVMYTQTLQAFSTVEPEMKRYPKMIVQLGRRVSELCKNIDAPVFAVPDSQIHPGACRFLEFLGFVRVDDDLYCWEGR